MVLQTYSIITFHQANIQVLFGNIKQCTLWKWLEVNKTYYYAIVFLTSSMILAKAVCP